MAMKVKDEKYSGHFFLAVGLCNTDGVGASTLEENNEHTQDLFPNNSLKFLDMFGLVYWLYERVSKF